MEYMRGLLRDNELFRAYVTVRAGGAAGRQVRGRRGPGPGGACPEPAPPRLSGPRGTSSASG